MGCCPNFHLAGFSPLFVGAGVAIVIASIIIIALGVFQSPICRGRRCNPLGNYAGWHRMSGFSPLFVGAGVAILAGLLAGRPAGGFSPLFVGAGVAIKFNILPHFC